MPRGENPMSSTKTFDPSEPLQVAEAATLAPSAPPSADPHQTADFAASPGPATPTPTLPQIPGYEILGELGRGGMGVVYKARQEKVNRLVALKMMLGSNFASLEARVRFLVEGEVLGRLQHPHIVQIYEVGTFAEQPFFVLEYVEGHNLAEHLQQQSLTPTVAATLVEQLARAVHYAHGNGVIHRDLKPANILLSLSRAPEARAADSAANVTDGPARASGARLNEIVPKITDFGLAKQTEVGTGLTVTGAVMGTPNYMAPEQAEGKGKRVTPATDVYALGAILYELLTGRPPFVGATPVDVLMKVVSEEPPSVTSLTKKLPGDLATICHKCLQKEPGKRYLTAAALADDLQCFLEHKPITARPVGRLERTWKWCRRYPAVAVLIVVSTLAAVVASGLAFWANHLRERAEQAEAETLADFKASTDEAIAQLIGSKAELGPRERMYLEKTLKRWQAFADRQQDDQRGRWIRGEGHYRMAILWSKLGRPDEWRRECELALGIRQQLVADFPSVPTYRADLASSHINLGVVLAHLEQRKEAAAAYRAAMNLLTPLAAEFPSVLDYKKQLAASHNNLGAVLSDLGQQKEAEVAYRAALQLQEQLAADFPTVPEYPKELADTFNNLGVLLDDRGMVEDALKAYRTAQKLRERLVADYPTVPEYRLALATNHNNLGGLLAKLGQFADAEAAYRKGLELREQLVAAFPTVPEYQHDLSSSHHNLGTLQANRGKYAAAEAAFRAALQIQDRLAVIFPTVPSYRQDLAKIHHYLGGVLSEQGKSQDAEAAYRVAMKLQERLVADFPTHPKCRQHLAHSHNRLGVHLQRMGQRVEAEAVFRASVQVLERLTVDFPSMPDYRRDLAGILCNLGHLAFERGEPVEALGWYAKSIDILAPLVQQEPRKVDTRQFLRNAHWGRAQTLEHLGRYAEADADWTKVIDLSPAPEKTAWIKERDKFRTKRKPDLKPTGRSQDKK